MGFYFNFIVYLTSNALSSETFSQFVIDQLEDTGGVFAA